MLVAGALDPVAAFGPAFVLPAAPVLVDLDPSTLAIAFEPAFVDTGLELAPAFALVDPEPFELVDLEFAGDLAEAAGDFDELEAGLVTVGVFAL